MIAQLSVLIDHTPKTGIILILIGSFLSLESLLLSSQSEVNGVLAIFLSLLMGAGLVLGVYQMHVSEPFLLVVIFGMAGKYIQGLAAVRLYQKFSYTLRNRSFSWGTVSLTTKVAGKLFILFVILLSGTVASLMIAIGLIDVPLSSLLVGLWTAAVILYTVFGLSVTLYSMSSDIPHTFSYGLVLLIAGAEVYNLASLRLEIASLLLLSLAYSLGFWIAAHRFVNEDPIVTEVTTIQSD